MQKFIGKRPASPVLSSSSELDLKSLDRLLASTISYRALEPRMVFDAAAAATAEAAVGEPAPGDAPDVQADGSVPQPGGEGQNGVDGAELLEAAQSQALVAGEPHGTQIVFIDGAVESIDQLIAGIDPSYEIILLDRDQDGVEQIAAALQGRQNIDAIHILSHGSEGELRLGNGVLTAASMRGEHLDELTAIGAALSADADILIYGCDFTGGAAGLEAAMILGGIAGADIAASVDDTGHVDLGGDWELETQFGEIEGNGIAATDWQGLLTANNDAYSINTSVTFNASGNVLSNDSEVSVTTVHGYAAFVGQPYQTSYGTITLNANGTFTYVVDSTNSTVMGLTSSQTITDIVAYGTGTTTADQAYITFTIRGSDDPPVATDNSVTATVGLGPASGNVIIDDQGSGPDSVDRPLSQLIWENHYGNLAGSINGTSVTVDGVTVNFATADPTGIGTTSNQNVSHSTNGGHFGYLVYQVDALSAVTSANYVSTTMGFSEAVVNLEFTLADIDYSQGTSWQDQFTIAATRAGQPVSFTAQVAGTVVTVGGNTFYGTGSVDAADAHGNVHIVFDGAVDNVVVQYRYGPNVTSATPGGQIGALSDLSWQRTSSVSVIELNGTPVPPGGLTVVGTFGTLTINQDGSYSYTPDPSNTTLIGLGAGQSVLESFTYTIQDTVGGTSSANLSITVNGVNDAPVAGNDAFLVAEDGSVSVAVLGNDTDPDGDALTVTHVDGQAVVDGGPAVAVANGTVALVAGDLVFTPAANYNGPASFSYTITDGTASATATVSGTVTPANDAPVAADDLIVTNEDSPVTFGVLGNDGDVDGDPITITHIAGVAVSPGQTVNLAEGTVTLNAGGTLTFRPQPNYNGPVSLTYAISDGQGGTDTARVTINVAPVNDAPVAADDRGSTVEGQPTTIDVLANDRDLDGDPLTVSHASATNGQVRITADGRLVYIPNPGFSGTEIITYTISDGHGGFSTAKVTIEVVPDPVVQPPVEAVELPKPDQPAPDMPDVNGAVLEAVESFNGHNTGFHGLGASGAVLDAANDAASLDGADRIVSSGPRLGVDHRMVHPVWALQEALRRSLESDMPWDVRGLTGFSLRYGLDRWGETTDTDGAQIVVESIVRDRVLMMQLSDTAERLGKRVIEFRVTGAGGAPLPDWLDRVGGKLIVGERPSDQEQVELRITAILSDGTVVTREIRVHTVSGEIQPLDKMRKAEAPSMFSDQVRRFASAGHDDIEDLRRALAG